MCANDRFRLKGLVKIEGRRRLPWSWCLQRVRRACHVLSKICGSNLDTMMDTMISCEALPRLFCDNRLEGKPNKSSAIVGKDTSLTKYGCTNGVNDKEGVCCREMSGMPLQDRFQVIRHNHVTGFWRGITHSSCWRSYGSLGCLQARKTYSSFSKGYTLACYLETLSTW